MIANNIDHEARRTRIGASEAAGILNLSPWTNGRTIWLEKTGRIEPSKDTKATSMGKRVESILLDEAESDLGKLERNVLCWAPDKSPIASTLDGRAIQSHDVVECKTSGITGGPVVGEWGEEGTDAIPMHYLVQAQIQVWCSESELNRFYSWLGARGIVKFQVYRDDELIKSLRGRLNDWWDKYVVANVEPPNDSPIPLDVAKRLRKQANKTISLPPEITVLWNRREKLKEQEKLAKDTIEEIDSQILLTLDDAEAGILPDGRQITYFETERRGYTVQPCTFRTLRIRKG